MKKIHLTRNEKQLLRQFKTRDVECPGNMNDSSFIYTVIQLQDKDLIDAYIALGKLREVKLTDRGRSYMTINPQLRNPFPLRIILDSATIIAAIAATAALFVGCLRLMNM